MTIISSICHGLYAIEAVTTGLLLSVLLGHLVSSPYTLHLSLSPIASMVTMSSLQVYLIKGVFLLTIALHFCLSPPDTYDCTTRIIGNTVRMLLLAYFNLSLMGNTG